MDNLIGYILSSIIVLGIIFVTIRGLYLSRWQWWLGELPSTDENVSPRIYRSYLGWHIRKLKRESAKDERILNFFRNEYVRVRENGWQRNLFYEIMTDAFPKMNIRHRSDELDTI